MSIYRDLMRDCVQTYLDTCAWLGVPRNTEMMPPRITQFVLPESATQHG